MMLKVTPLGSVGVLTGVNSSGGRVLAQVGI